MGVAPEASVVSSSPNSPRITCARVSSNATDAIADAAEAEPLVALARRLDATRLLIASTRMTTMPKPRSFAAGAIGCARVAAHDDTVPRSRIRSRATVVWFASSSQ